MFKKIAAISLFSLLSITALASCSKEEKKTSTSAEDFNSDVVVEEINDEIGRGYPIGTKRAGDVEAIADSLKADLGVMLMKNDNGTYNIRYIGAFSGYNTLSEATFTRGSYTNAAGKMVAEKATRVEYVYSSINNDSEIKWASPLDSKYTWFMAYTVRNIPESDIFTSLNVTLTAKVRDTTDVYSAAQIANVQGIVGDISKNVSYKKAVDSSGAEIDGEYSVTPILKDTSDNTSFDTSITSAVVAPYYATYEGFVATKLGKVTHLDKRAKYDGAFESCRNLETISLPETISYFGQWSFSGCKALKEMTFPRDLVKIEGSSFNSNTWKTLHYNAKNLVEDTYARIDFGNLDTVYVSSEVESLPDKLVNSSYKVSKVVYEGTTAEWNALKTESNASNGLFIKNTYCSDTKTLTVNFHLNGGVLSSDPTVTADFSKVVISGNTVDDPGKLTKTGVLFDTWCSDAALLTPFDFSTILTVPEGEETTTVDIYAKYKAYPEGAVESAPYELALNGEAFSIALTQEVTTYYFKYTAPANATRDLYYFTGENKLLNGSTTSDDYSITVYESDRTTVASSTYSFSPLKLSQKYKVFGHDDETLAVLINPGETYYFNVSMNSYDKLTATDTLTADFKLITKANDFENEATDYAFNTEVITDVDEKLMPYQYYKFTVATAGEYVMRKIQHGSFTAQNMTIYHYDDTGAVKIDKEISSSTSTGAVSLSTGVQYYMFASTSNSTKTEANYLSLIVGDAPANFTPSSATALPVDGTEADVTLNDFSSKYYSITPTATGNYTLKLTGGSTSYAKVITVYQADATEFNTSTQLGSVTEEGIEEGDEYWNTYTSYGTATELLVNLEAGKKYIVKIAYSGSTTKTDAIKFKMTHNTPGSIRETAIALTSTAKTNVIDPTSVVGSTSGMWYKFTTAEADYITFYLEGLADGNEATIKVYSGTYPASGMAGTNPVSFYASAKSELHILITTTAAQETGLTLKSVVADKTSITGLDTLEAGSTTTAMPLTLNDCGVTYFEFATKSDVIQTQLQFTVSAGTATFDYDIGSRAVSSKKGTVSASTAVSNEGTAKIVFDSSNMYLALRNVVLSDASATISVTAVGAELPPDGTSAARAIAFEGDADCKMDTIGDNKTYWVKYTCTETGTYRIWTASIGGDARLFDCYASLEDATAETGDMVGATVDDKTIDGYTTYKYDFYKDLTFETGKTYYIYFKTGTTSKLGIKLLPTETVA